MRRLPSVYTRQTTRALVTGDQPDSVPPSTGGLRRMDCADAGGESSKSARIAPRIGTPEAQPNAQKPRATKRLLTIGSPRSKHPGTTLPDYPDGVKQPRGV